MLGHLHPLAVGGGDGRALHRAELEHGRGAEGENRRARDHDEPQGAAGDIQSAAGYFLAEQRSTRQHAEQFIAADAARQGAELAFNGAYAQGRKNFTTRGGISDPEYRRWAAAYISPVAPGGTAWTTARAKEAIREKLAGCNMLPAVHCDTDAYVLLRCVRFYRTASDAMHACGNAEGFASQ